ncbi:hypothetical protein GQ44DRAFT_790507 [Phaeosphaeriaceae sp. PMI808]|nr:hypothetical protein GQ44DRAFT_790507 [Phaeosphaeriaceae sp. PMI808]
MLGFQSYESSPSFKEPMPLPMQWESPIGWLQFRPSDNGCIAEFRRRMDQPDQIPNPIQSAFQGVSLHGLQILLSRLWNSIAGLLLPDGRALYLGSLKYDDEEGDDPDANQNDVYEQLMSQDLSTEKILEGLFHKRETRSGALRRQTGVNMTRRPPRRMTAPTLRWWHSLRPVFEGELAYNRGLEITKCEEYDCEFIKRRDIDEEKYPSRLGDLYMDDELLSLMKDALPLLEPDGYYFAPESSLYVRLNKVFNHIDQQFKKVEILPLVPLLPGADDSRRSLHYALKLFNMLRQTRKTHYSLKDMEVVARAAKAMWTILTRAKGSGTDLMWAFIFCPQFSLGVLYALKRLDIANLPYDKGRTMKYDIPLLGNAGFTGLDVLAALMKVRLAQFWLFKGWKTDVAAYDFTMPQSILML